MDIAIYLSDPDQFQGCDLSDYRFQFTDFQNNSVSEAYQNMQALLIQRGVLQLTHLYFGAEFCEFLIPSSRIIQKYIDICKANHLQPVFVTPVVTDYGIQQLQEAFDFLDTQILPYAVVINDFGVLQMLCSRSNTPEIIAGRILDKTSHDCRIPAEELTEYYSVSGMRYAQTPGILSNSSIQILSKMNITRFEFDLPKTGLHLAGTQKQFSLYWPFHYLTTGRVCIFRSLHKTGNQKFLVGGKSCTAPCKAFDLELSKPLNGYSFEYGRRKKNQHLFQKGNTIFYLYENPEISSQVDQVDRIIIQIF